MSSFPSSHAAEKKQAANSRPEGGRGAGGGGGLLTMRIPFLSQISRIASQSLSLPLDERQCERDTERKSQTSTD